MKPTKAQAKDPIQRALDEISTLMSMSYSPQEFTKWHRNTKIAIEYTFRGNSKHIETFKNIRYNPMSIIVGVSDYQLHAEYRKAYVYDLERAQAILESMVEEIEEYAETVGFAVALGTPDDVGALADGRDNPRPRVRQNVVLELGYLAAALGRKRVCVLLKGDVERPSDYDGVIYIPLDDFGGWQMELAKEMKMAGLPVDLNRLLSA